MSFKQFNPEYQPDFCDFQSKDFENFSPEQQARYLPNFVNAYLLAQVSQLSYKSSVNADSSDESYKEAVRWALMNSGISPAHAKETIFLNSREIKDEQGNSTPGTQGLIIFHQETAIIAFRGSEKKFNDWAYNANIKRTDFPYEINDEGGNGDETIHQGFLEAFQAVVPKSESDKSKFDSILKKLKSCNYIWLTGHSLGGAIAIIAASFLKKRGFNNIQGIYTYGAPRVGNDDYRNYINRVFKNKYWRFMNDHDVVPDLPPSYKFGGYSREGCMLRLKQRNNQSEYELLRIVNLNGERKRYGKRYDGYSASDHNITEYANRLSELIKPQELVSESESKSEEESKSEKELKNIKVTFLEEGKLLGENPEVFKLKREILLFFDELIKSERTNITLEEVAKQFKINNALLDWLNVTTRNNKCLDPQ